MTATAGNAQLGPAETTAVATLVAISVSHFLNDMIQSLIPAIYPVLKDSFALDFTQIGLITLAFNITASLLQPVVGLYTDRRPLPFSLTIGMGIDARAGCWCLPAAPTYRDAASLGAALVGLGSAVFHPESSRVARLASGGRYGFAQSLFQVGGNVGSALGPLLAALIVVPFGQSSIAWFSVIALARHGRPVQCRHAGTATACRCRSRRRSAPWSAGSSSAARGRRRARWCSRS